MSSLYTASDYKNIFEEHLSELQAYYTQANNPLAEAVSYALDGQGKRVRPTLVFLCNQLCSGELTDGIAAALATEMVHCYSLIHDDLPIMDDDDMRRGRATLHKKFDDPTALLAGNALLTDSFLLLANPKLFLSVVHDNLNIQQKLLLQEELSQAVGSQGILYGQTMDMYWTKRENPTMEDLDDIHLHKTGNLIAGACVMGAITANANKETQGYLKRFGNLIGLSFQIIDDVIDENKKTGKSQGKDKQQNKLSYLRLIGKEESLRIARKYTDKALSELAKVASGVKKEELVAFVQDLIKRDF